ncbi:MAG: GNAT family protein [Chloroflexi bacterium]|nr:GNAT family protein [Chloroflexota bacterium]MDA1239511.1 GNAT family protein [Chloroflexota bacterium]
MTGESIHVPSIIRGELVRLVPAEPRMAAPFVAWLNEPDTAHLIGRVSYPIALAAEEEWVRRKSRVSWEDGVWLAIEAIDGPQPILIGAVELRDLSAEARRGDVGILIGDPAYRGGGYGTEAMRLLCRIAFQEMDLQRIELNTSEFNTRAVRSYEKVGFVVEGRQRRRAHVGGRYYDVILMGLLREEFRDA